MILEYDLLIAGESNERYYIRVYKQQHQLKKNKIPVRKHTHGSAELNSCDGIIGKLVQKNKVKGDSELRIMYFELINEIIIMKITKCSNKQ